MEVLEAIQQIRDVFALAGLKVATSGGRLTTDLAAGTQTLVIDRVDATKIDGYFPDPPMKLLADRGFRVIGYDAVGAIGELACANLKIEPPLPHPPLSADNLALIAELGKMKPGDRFVLPSGTEIKIVRWQMKDDVQRQTVQDFLNKHDSRTGRTTGPTEPPKPDEPPSLHRRATNFFMTDVREKKK